MRILEGMRNTLIIAAICVAVLVLGVWFYAVSTKGPQPAQENAQATAPVERAVTRLDQGANAASYTSRRNYAIYDASAFAKFWKNVHGANTQVPKVDFSKEFVIAAFAGEKPTGGYGIDVSRVVDQNGKRTVTVTITSPGAGCATAQAKTQPYAFAVVAASDALPLTHEDVAQTKDCK